MTLCSLLKEKTNFIPQKFISFDKSFKLTINTFEQCFPHFQNFKIFQNGQGNFQKHTKYDQYTNITSML